MKRGIAVMATVALLAFAAPSPIAGQDATTITVGITNSAADAPLLITDKLGYFKEQGINVTFLPFDSASKMIAPLGAGQLDVATGAPSAALYNAIALKVDVKIVADKSSSPPGYGFQPILVRKALVTSGAYKSPKDFKGMRFAEGAQGTGAASMLSRMLKSAGLQYGDLTHVYLGFPLMITAFENGAIDAGALTEPSATVAIRSGYAVKVLTNDTIYPNEPVGVLMYGSTFIRTKRDLAQRFMNAYIRGARYYNDSLVDGHIRGRTANDVVRILTESTGIKDASIFRTMTPSACDPNGRINTDGLRDDLAFFKAQGLVKDADVTVDGALDPSFLDATLKLLGPYKPNK